MLAAAVILAAVSAQVVSAASADDWKTRSIYQIITDRFAPPSDTAPARTDPLPTECDPMEQTWCGGTWLSIIDKLDYIQSLGSDAIWISPTSQNLDLETPYKFAYHGYWVNDPTKLNPRFGTAEDLKKLCDEVHKRDMYIMVDVVVNHIPGMDIQGHNNITEPDADNLAAVGSIYTDPSSFHSFCPMDYSNITSEENCWMGDSKLWLMDVNTENEAVQNTLHEWINGFVKEYGIDGLRIDAAKHIPAPFWKQFCGTGGAAGVFCMGEVFTGATSGAEVDAMADYQTQGNMDSVLGFPLYNSIVESFAVAPHGNISAFVDGTSEVLNKFPRPEILGNFIENHDVPRFRNITADPRLVLNAMVAQFMFEGIPVVYYGQEQDEALGNHDPYNRANLWRLGYEQTETMKTIAQLNRVRKALITHPEVTFNGQSYMDARSTLLLNTTYDAAFRKGPIIFSVTNRGSPEETGPQYAIYNTGWSRGTAIVDLLSCKESVVGSGDSVSITYSRPGTGGLPYIYMDIDSAAKLNICHNGDLGIADTSAITNTEGKNNRAGNAGRPTAPLSTTVIGTAAIALVPSLLAFA